MMNHIKKLSDFVATNIKEKMKSDEQKFKEFHEFHKWLLENIDPVLWEKVGTIQGIARKNIGYGIKISLEDYKWWNEIYRTTPDIDFIPLKEIQNKIFEKLLSVSESYGVKTCEQIKATIAMIDGIFESENVK